jgi:dienelactone hydrolase
MKTIRFLPVLWLGLWAWSCSNNDNSIKIDSPVSETATPRSYPVQDVTFQSIDDVPISATFAQLEQSDELRPAVILVHDLLSQNGKNEWFFFFEDLLERGYLPLAIDLRGHGNTPLPNDERPGPGLLIIDVENSHLDVKAAIDWLKQQQGVDFGRIAVIGHGGGANVAYVSVGAFPSEIQAVVAVSPGFWSPNDSAPLVVGNDIDQFAPHSVLYMVGEQDDIPNTDLSYFDFIQTLASLTADPTATRVFPGAAHGLDLLGGDPEAVEILLDWLDVQLQQ